MKSGIYLLTFKTGDSYVGQAKDFNRRVGQHFKQLVEDKHSNKMQTAYYLSGELPEANILLRCHPHYLDLYEAYFINELEPTLNHQIPDDLNSYDTLWMSRLANMGFANNSIPKLVELAITYGDVIKERDETLDDLDDLVAIEAKAIEGHEQALTKLEALEAEVSKLRGWKRGVESLGWWGRLWKMW